MEGLVVSDANLTAYIHPSMSNRIRRAILSQLSSLLFKYEEIFDGVLLAFQVVVVDRSAKILPGLASYFGVKLKANLLIFSPKTNMLVEGKVVKLGRESVHATVLGFSSAAIMLEDIRREFKYKIKDGVATFISRYHKQHSFKVGSTIRFIVKSMDEEMIHISGSLVPPNTGCIYWLSKHEVDRGSQKERQMKRHRSKGGDIEEDAHKQQLRSLSKRSRSHESITRMQ